MKTIVSGTSSFGKASSAPEKLLEKYGYKLIKNPHGRTLTKEETIELLQDADGLLAGLEPLDREVLEKSRGKLKALARVGIGMDNVDAEAAKEFGIAVSNTPDAPTEAVAEMTLATALGLARGVPTANMAMHAGKWEKKMGSSLKGATVLIVGYGRIGRAVARAFEFMGANILVYDPAFPDISIKNLEDGLKAAKFLSIHASGNKKIIEKKHLDLLPDGAFLLNAARGGMVDEDAIYEALKSGKLAGCWLDVFEEEPYKGPLAKMPNALLTPHISSYTAACREKMELEAVRNLLRDLGEKVDDQA